MLNLIITRPHREWEAEGLCVTQGLVCGRRMLTTQAQLRDMHFSLRLGIYYSGVGIRASVRTFESGVVCGVSLPYLQAINPFLQTYVRLGMDILTKEPSLFFRSILTSRHPRRQR